MSEINEKVEDRNCYVYFITETKCSIKEERQKRRNKKYYPPVKIGRSFNPMQRLKELQVGNYKRLEIKKTLECRSEKEAKTLEKSLHAMAYKKYGKGISGEWFIIYGSWKLMIKAAEKCGNVFACKQYSGPP
jgi:hypothetical protein